MITKKRKSYLVKLKQKFSSSKLLALQFSLCARPSVRVCVISKLKFSLCVISLNAFHSHFFPPFLDVYELLKERVKETESVDQNNGIRTSRKEEKSAEYSK